MPEGWIYVSWYKQPFKAGTIKIILELLNGKWLPTLGLLPVSLLSLDFTGISVTPTGESRILGPLTGDARWY